MGRINGANSDYLFDTDKGTVVENKDADPLFMKLFICPNNQPNAVESGTDICEGTQETCPEPIKAGHAMVQLHQTDGIILQTDGGMIQLHQTNGIILQTNGGTIITMPNNEGVIDINGLQIVEDEAKRILRLGEDGACIELHEDGNINFVPKPGGQVMINNVPIPPPA